MAIAELPAASEEESGGKEIGFLIPRIDFLNTEEEPNARLVLGDDDATTGMPSVPRSRGRSPTSTA